jgi:hypothetical protein
MRLIERTIHLILSPLYWIQGLTWRLTRPRMPDLMVDDEGFSISNSGKVATKYRWDEVGQIVGFKRDHGMYDEICLQIDIRCRVGVLELSEEFGGFDKFIKAMEEHLPGIPRDWWQQLAFPVFAENGTIIYRRVGAA